MTEAYPLQWPPGWPRTPAHKRIQSRFAARGLAEESSRIYAELQRLGARYPVVSTDVALRRDGIPYSNRRRPEDPGVAVYFDLNGRQQCIPCDRWSSVEENARAIWKSVEALRGLERWGAKSFVDAAFSGFQALPPPSSEDRPHWSAILGVPRFAKESQIKAAYKAKAMDAHPDRPGGSSERMAEINDAYNQAMGAGMPSTFTYCDRCNNTGWIDCRCGGDLCLCGEGELPCPQCGGDIPDDDARCPTCEGSGRINPLTAPKGHFVAGAADCPHCDGTGRI
ncbi:DnaJ domain-containing protein [Kaustia mangrovi]|uniref:DnaJ domain-containing protein n=1 Tax=Kaustia mangrovi TaxID=2593653 RepID=A0A7S8C698_9HYPH|nr:DnaJ domain-containing protein [Kaustia mangrovi]QPC43984.1 DnaJ domain-containing protein [Kaustia mangrovi]